MFGVAVPRDGSAASTATLAVATLSIVRASRVGVGSGLTEGTRAGATSSDELAACPRFIPLLSDDAGTVTHAVTIKKTTRAALIAARRLGRRRDAGRPACFCGVRVLASEESALVSLRWARRDGSLLFNA